VPCPRHGTCAARPLQHLGHFELASRLHAALSAGASALGEASIVWLSSSGHLYSPVVFDDLHFAYRQYTETLAYGQAKTANVLFGVGATARWADDGISANAAMPGPTLTGFQRNMDPERLRQRLGGADLAPGEVPPGFKTLNAAPQPRASSTWDSGERHCQQLGS
jgi:NAD(P)-dependent dehydrogenase (short-subunit alcohol dehydrogenase family)